MTRSADAARFFASHGGTLATPNPIIAIDLNALRSPVLDVSTKELATGALNHPRAINFAARWEEVLARGGVNPEAILGFVSGGL